MDFVRSAYQAGGFPGAAFYGAPGNYPGASFPPVNPGGYSDPRIEPMPFDMVDFTMLPEMAYGMPNTPINSWFSNPQGFPNAYADPRAKLALASPGGFFPASTLARGSGLGALRNFFGSATAIAGNSISGLPKSNQGLGSLFGLTDDLVNMLILSAILKAASPKKTDNVQDVDDDEDDDDDDDITPAPVNNPTSTLVAANKSATLVGNQITGAKGEKYTLPLDTSVETEEQITGLQEFIVYHNDEDNGLAEIMISVGYQRNLAPLKDSAPVTILEGGDIEGVDEGEEIDGEEDPVDITAINNEAYQQALAEVKGSALLPRTLSIKSGANVVELNADNIAQLKITDKDAPFALKTITLTTAKATHTTEDGTVYKLIAADQVEITTPDGMTTIVKSHQGSEVDGNSLSIEVKSGAKGVKADDLPEGILGETFNARTQPLTGLLRKIGSYMPFLPKFDEVNVNNLIFAMTKANDFDKNKDNALSVRELSEAAKFFASKNQDDFANAARHLADLLKMGSPVLDINGDGKLNYDCGCSGENRRYSEANHLAAAFGDSDRLSIEDTKAVQFDWMPETASTVRSWFKKYDTNNDNKVSAEELALGREAAGNNGQVSQYLIAQAIENVLNQASWMKDLFGTSASLVDPDGDGMIDLGTETNNVFTALAANSSPFDRFIDAQDFIYPWLTVPQDEGLEG